MQSYRSKICPRCGEPGMTKDNNHRGVKNPITKTRMYHCPWDRDHFIRTGNFKRMSIAKGELHG